MNDKQLVLGKCPKCGDVYNVECCHETVNGNELFVWSECGNCGHQFIEVFRLARIEEWKDRR